MAICRWSDYRCDLYIYEGQDGIRCHVAHRRYVDEPEPPAVPPADGDDGVWRAWHAAYLAYRERLAATPLEPIGLPYAGESKSFGDWAGLLAYVVGLRELGCWVPDWVVGEIEGLAAAEEDGGDDALR